MGSRSGFTLIELIVVITVAGLFIGLLSSNFYSAKEQKNLLSAQSEVRSLLDLTRQKSTSILIPEGVDANAFQGYGINILDSINGNKIELVYFYYVYTPNPVLTMSAPVNTVSLSRYPHVEIVSVAPLAVGPVYFEKQTALLLDSDSNKKDITINLMNTINNKCASVSVSQFGVITGNDQVTCP